MVEAVAMRDDIELKMAMHESTADDHVKTFPTLDLETSAVAPKCQRETGETESDGEAKIEANKVMMANREAKNKAKTKFDKESDNKKKGRTRIQSRWKMTGLVF